MAERSIYRGIVTEEPPVVRNTARVSGGTSHTGVPSLNSCCFPAFPAAKPSHNTLVPSEDCRAHCSATDMPLWYFCVHCGPDRSTRRINTQCIPDHKTSCHSALACSSLARLHNRTISQAKPLQLQAAGELSRARKFSTVQVKVLTESFLGCIDHFEELCTSELQEAERSMGTCAAGPRTSEAWREHGDTQDTKGFSLTCPPGWTC